MKPRPPINALGVCGLPLTALHACTRRSWTMNEGAKRALVDKETYLELTQDGTTLEYWRSARFV